MAFSNALSLMIHLSVLPGLVLSSVEFFHIWSPTKEREIPGRLAVLDTTLRIPVSIRSMIPIIQIKVSADLGPSLVHAI